MTKFIIAAIFLIHVITGNGQTFQSFTYGKTGSIQLPHDWKVYDDKWNGEITARAGFSNSKKKTIIRASDYTKSTIYIKLSSKLLDEAMSKSDIQSNDFLDALNEDLKQITQLIKSDSKKKFIESSNSISEAFGSAFGGSVSYSYAEDSSTRKTIIYTMIKGSIFYNLTISWDVKNKVAAESIANEIKSRIVFSD